ncbi:uncharacterized protein LOC124325718 [Daphnia pulicaria]|uniref:uncharacterized protein LOC124325718 n=1 Tax=Daphnia pulicaria TaxID=35523 RepID=UPI001EEB5380|nr:uncharacterized protein LOC124325718 [Daphnia pulicaria]
MSNEHSDLKFSRSSSSLDHNVLLMNQGSLVAANEDHSADVVASPVHPIMDPNENPTDNSMTATALVLGLGSAVLFLLLVVYVVVKVHFCKKQTSKKKMSTPSHETIIKSSPLPTVSSIIQNQNTFSLNNDSTSHSVDNANQQSGLDIYRIHSLGFSSQSPPEPTLTDNATQARLTGARFLPGN